ncbi:MAG: xylS, partial [Paenibacillus sp.]|nr:xylS [Paenibacillus sp.]
MDIQLKNGLILKVELLTDFIFRIRKRSDRLFNEPAMIKYGIIRKEWPQVQFHTEETDEIVIFRTTQTVLKIRKEDGQVSYSDDRENLLLQEVGTPLSSNDSGFAAEFQLAEDEKLYGLGDESRYGIQKRGHRAKMWVKNVESYSPIPFLMSSRGWGFFLNSTWRHFFDLGQTKVDRWKVFSKQGELDYYLIAGSNYAQILDRYTDITGKPQLLPLWGYGLTFVCNQQADAREMLDDAMHFRREGIPCDLIGLEPGWMAKNYDYSINKKWHEDRFYVPYWAPQGPQTFIGALERSGFKLSLWLCSDYDITHHEERLAEKRAQPDDERTESSDFHADDFEQDLHMHTPVYLDKLTKL